MAALMLMLVVLMVRVVVKLLVVPVVLLVVLVLMGAVAHTMLGLLVMWVAVQKLEAAEGVGARVGVVVGVDGSVSGGGDVLRPRVVQGAVVVVVAVPLHLVLLVWVMLKAVVPVGWWGWRHWRCGYGSRWWRRLCGSCRWGWC